MAQFMKTENPKVVQEQHLKMVEATLNTDGWEVADAYNKSALEAGVIWLETYRKAARLIVAARLAI